MNLLKDEKDSSLYEWNSNLRSFELFIGDSGEISNSQVKRWLKDPMQYHYELRHLSRRMYNTNGVYTNVIDYMISLPTLDSVVYSHNKSNHKTSKQNVDKYKSALKKIRDKVVIRDVLRKSAIDGLSFYYFNTELSPTLPSTLEDHDISQISEINDFDFNCAFMPLPTDYCKIIGTLNSSYVVAFNLSYFDQFLSNGRSLKLKRYPQEIRKRYQEYRKDLTKKWVVLDNKKTVAIKVRASIEEPYGRPLGLAAFIDMLYEDYFTESKRGVLDDNNNLIIYQTFPEGDSKGSSSLTNTQQKDQHDNIRNALFARGNRKKVSFFSVAAGTKLDKVSANVELLKTNSEEALIKKIATDLGFAGSALNGEGSNFTSQKTNLDLVAAEIFSWVEQLESEFNKVINYNIIQDPKDQIEVYYLPITYINRSETIANMKDLYTLGKGSLIAWISATGFRPDAYLALMDYEIAEDFEEKYKPHLTSFTATEDGGRPSNDNPTNENTIKSKTNGSNDYPKNH
ncbi:hypothetical protein L8C07_05280 [Paenibacillus sp. CMAA1739]|uniref:hypothetical protein n=1 Tax=Paenibacillus ottowii TaxID=2315729 RepID=UPI002DBAE05E|nr:hypothetical protein [Paenibacillus sp. CMAA1739]MEC4565349.1 hypothetical protein [Paenibacillus sp. CMAA1739]